MPDLPLNQPLATGVAVSIVRPNGRGDLPAEIQQGLAQANKVGAEIGQTGLRRFGGYRTSIDEEFLPQLKGQRAIDVYREMASNDAVISSFLFVITMLMRKMEWRIEPFDDTEEHHKNADFLEESLEDMAFSWQDVVTNALSMLTYGWAAHEIVYKRRKGYNRDEMLSSRFDDGKIGWAHLPIRGQKTLNGWVYDGDGNKLLGLRQLSPPRYGDRFIPMEKMVLFRTTTMLDSPEGQSILRGAYRSWYFLKRLQEIEGIGIERDLAGLPVMYVPPEVLESKPNSRYSSERLVWEQMIRNVRRDQQEGVLLPLAYTGDGKEKYRFELLSTGGARQFNTNEVVNRYESRIAMTVLADFLLLGTQSVGSWSLSADKVNLFAEALRAWAKVLANAMNRQAVPRLFRLNDMPVDKLPTMVPGDIVAPSIADLGQFMTSLSTAGMPLFPNEELEDYLMEVAHLPKIPETVRADQEAQRQTQAEQQLAGIMGPGGPAQGATAQSPAGFKPGGGAPPAAPGQPPGAQGQPAPGPGGGSPNGQRTMAGAPNRPGGGRPTPGQRGGVSANRKPGGGSKPPPVARV